MKLKDLPEFPPHVDDSALVFGDTKYLPNYTELPEDYRSEKASGCKIVEAIFFGGWQAGLEEARNEYGDSEIDLASPPESHDFSGEKTDPVERFQRVISAELKSFQPKHEHKIAGVGYLMDYWTAKMKPEHLPKKL